MPDWLSAIIFAAVLGALVLGTEIGAGICWVIHDLYDLSMLASRELGLSFAKGYKSSYEQLAESPTDYPVGLIGEIAMTFSRSDSSPLFAGRVLCQGAYWRANSGQESIANRKKGDKVKIVGRDGLTLRVEIAEVSESAV